MLIALDRLARWSWLRVTAVVLSLAALLVLAGLAASGTLASGLWIAIIFVLFAGLDGLLLGALPLLRLSFGPVQPSLLSLCAVRWLLGLAGLAFGFWLSGSWALAVALTAQLLLSALVVYGCFVEPFRLTLTRLHVESVKLAGLAQPLTLLHLSDLHMERLTRRDKRVLRLAEELAPDVIVLTGDFLNLSYTDDDQAIHDAREWLSCLCAPLGVFAVLGTPEVDVRHRVDELFANTGVRLLRDEAELIGMQPQMVAVLGVTCDRDLDRDVAGLDAAMRWAPEASFRILPYHMPDLMPQAVSRGVDLYLTGHTHGGQWRVPGYGALITSSAYGKRYGMGDYVEGDTRLYVSRGLGLEGLAAPRARFGCPPEVVLVTLGAGA